jgi:hypothetical protein
MATNDRANRLRWAALAGAAALAALYGTLVAVAGILWWAVLPLWIAAAVLFFYAIF